MSPDIYHQRPWWPRNCWVGQGIREGVSYVINMSCAKGQHAIHKHETANTRLCSQVSSKLGGKHTFLSVIKKQCHLNSSLYSFVTAAKNIMKNCPYCTAWTAAISCTEGLFCRTDTAYCLMIRFMGNLYKEEAFAFLTHFSFSQ